MKYTKQATSLRIAFVWKLICRIGKRNNWMHQGVCSEIDKLRDALRLLNFQLFNKFSIFEVWKWNWKAVNQQSHIPTSIYRPKLSQIITKWNLFHNTMIRYDFRFFFFFFFFFVTNIVNPNSLSYSRCEKHTIQNSLKAVI